MIPFEVFRLFDVNLVAKPYVSLLSDEKIPKKRAKKPECHLIMTGGMIYYLLVSRASLHFFINMQNVRTGEHADN